MKKQQNSPVKKYTYMGIIATAVVVVALLGTFAVSHLKKTVATSATEPSVPVEEATTAVTPDAAKASDLRIAIVNMDKIQTEAKVLDDLHKQRADYEKKLKAKLEKEQKSIEKEKKDIEKSQDILSQEALQKRVIDYQRRINDFQRQLSDSAQSIETTYQNALQTIQKEHLDPVIQTIIAKKDLSLVIDGRMARIGANAKDLDITDEVVDALNKKVSSVKMEKPKGL